MRYYGYFDIDLYCGVEVEDQDYEPMDFNEVYRERQWNFCEVGKSILAEYAGISRRSIPEAFNSLKENCLIEEQEDNYGWKVYLHPTCSYKISYLNKNALILVGKNYRAIRF